METVVLLDGDGVEKIRSDETMGLVGDWFIIFVTGCRRPGNTMDDLDSLVAQGWRIAKIAKIMGWMAEGAGCRGNIRDVSLQPNCLQDALEVSLITLARAWHL